MTVDGPGNVYVTGSSYGLYTTVKYYPDGRTAWAKFFWSGGNAPDWPTDIAVDRSGNVYVTGYTVGAQANNYDYTTVKYSKDGNQEWVRKYNGLGNGNDDASALAMDDSGNVYVTGYSPGIRTDNDYATIKYRPNGDTAWVRRYDSPENRSDIARAIAVDGNQNIYVTGSTGYSIYVQHVWYYFDYYTTVKYNAKGDLAWVRNSVPGRQGVPHAIAADNSGNVYIAGEGGYSFSPYYVTMKYYPNGDTGWVRRYSGPAASWDVAGALTVDCDGNIYVTGKSYGSSSKSDYATIKYHANGDTAWVRRYNGLGDSYDDAGNIYVTGSSYSAGAYYDYATIKYYPNGDVAWTVRYNGLADSNDYAADIAIDDSGNVYVTGYSYSRTSYDDYLTIKYVQFLRGDANRDKKVTIVDAVYVVSYLLKGGVVPNPLQAADANCDGAVTIGDVVYLVSFLFKHGPEPCR